MTIALVCTHAALAALLLAAAGARVLANDKARRQLTPAHS